MVREERIAKLGEYLRSPEMAILSDGILSKAVGLKRPICLNLRHDLEDHGIIPELDFRWGKRKGEWVRWKVKPRKRKAKMGLPVAPYLVKVQRKPTV